MSDSLKGMDALTERALGVLTSSKMLNALDLTKEPEKVRDRYGDGKPYKFVEGKLGGRKWADEAAAA